MAIKFVRETDSGLILGQYAGETTITVTDGRKEASRKAFLYYHQDGSTGAIRSDKAKLTSGFRHGGYRR